MRRRALFACASLAALSATAQPIGMEQIARRPAETGGIDQIPAGTAERAAPKPPVADRAASPPANASTPLAAAPKRPSRSSVDADEIARLLGNGQATSIDAAAALALGTLDAARTPPAEDPHPDEAGALAAAIAATGEKP